MASNNLRDLVLDKIKQIYIELGTEDFQQEVEDIFDMTLIDIDDFKSIEKLSDEQLLELYETCIIFKG